MALHEVQLKGYSVRPGNLSLGTFDSYGIEQLHVTLDDTWSGLAVTATFNPPDGEPVEIRVPENGLIDVPAEATANEGTGSIVYCGVANGVQLITKTQGYNVITHGNVGGTEPFNPSEPLATQVLQAALNAEKNSAEAKDVADGLRNDAANGKFNGKDGAKGDKGETGTTPQLKIGEDNLWQVSYDNGETWVSLGVKATGEAGKDGEDGLTPHIGKNGNWWLGNTDTGISAKGDKGDTGAKGADGVSPTASVTQTDDGAEFTVTDASGTTTATIRNGTDGRDGDFSEPSSNDDFGEEYIGLLDTSNFSGAFETAIYRILNAWPGTQLIYMTEHKMPSHYNDGTETLYQTAEKICKKWCVPILDMWNSGGLNMSVLANNKAYGTGDVNLDGIHTDTTHPNGEAYRLYYVPKLKSKLLECCPKTN